jgi:diguanylate cyclase (GGDEF)-like protein
MLKLHLREFRAERLPYLADHGTQSPSIERKLVETLFAQPATLLMGAAAMALLGLLEWWRLGGIFWLGWTAAVAVVLVWRVRQAGAFWREADRHPPEEWARRFAYGAWAVGLLWGSGSIAVIAMTDDTLARFLMIAVQAAYLGSGAFRNNAAPAAAVGQVYLSQVPLFLGCLATGNVYYILYDLILGQHIVSNLRLVEFLSERTVGFLVSDEKNEQLARQIEQVNEQLQRSNEQLSLLAATDGLTGLPNRRSFDAKLASEWQRAVRSEEALSLLMIDVDKFKSYNDTFGHQAGDRCLHAVATALQGTIQRATDLPARYGGEEFAVILPATDDAGAEVIAERIRAAVLELRLPRSNDEDANGDDAIVSVSLGAATLRPRRGAMPGELVAAADEALYSAKKAGRNCVRAATQRPVLSTAVADTREAEAARVGVGREPDGSTKNCRKAS